MTNAGEFLESVQDLLSRFLKGEIDGEKMVRYYDHLMADEIPDELDRASHDVLDEFHTEFALFVASKELRAEHPQHYYGPEELRAKVSSLRSRLGRR